MVYKLVQCCVVGSTCIKNALHVTLQGGRRVACNTGATHPPPPANTMARPKLPIRGGKQVTWTRPIKSKSLVLSLYSLITHYSFGITGIIKETSHDLKIF